MLTFLNFVSKLKNMDTNCPTCVGTSKPSGSGCCGDFGLGFPTRMTGFVKGRERARTASEVPQKKCK